MFRRTLVLALALFSAAAAHAQTATETLLDDEVESGFLVAPDVKLTEVDRDFAALAGAYGGWVIDSKLLLGGGVYTLVSGGHDTDMTYGGGVVEYFLNPSELVNFSFRGLVGGGSASLEGPFRGDFDLDDFDFPRRRLPDIDFSKLQREVSSSFFVAEPEANLNLNITEVFRIGFGGGYRFIGGAGGLNDRLDGFFASAALKLSFF